MFAQAYLTISLISSLHSLMHCGSNVGTFVIPIYVHIDPRSLIKIRTSLIKQYNRDLNTMASSLKFIGAVFDIVNEELQRFGVQIESDLTKLVHKKKCVSLASSIVQMPFKNVNLYILDCKNDKVRFHTENNGCNINIGVSFGDLRVMTDTLKMVLIKALGKSEYKNQNEYTLSFNTNLCSYAKQCSRMEVGLKSVRNIGSEEYITGLGYEKRMHDLYDDVSSGQNGDPKLYATQDYSNEDELYADFVN